MGNKQDIGKLIEQKLSAGKKIPTENLWEKVNTTLETEKRRRKRVLYYWLVGGGLTVLLGLFLLNSPETLFKNSNIKQKNNTPVTEKPSITSEKESNENYSVISKDDSLKIQNEEKLSKIVISDKNSDLNTIEESTRDHVQGQQKESKKESKNSKNKKESYTVSKNYYYYNSKDGKQLVTNSKREIDSLISEGHKAIDSLTTKKIDSIN